MLSGTTLLAAACAEGKGGGNHPPELGDAFAVTDEDASLSITLAATDADGDTLAASLTMSPANGTASAQDLDVTYTPDADFNGTDTFTVRVTDGDESIDALVTVTVLPVNDLPVGVADAASTDEDQELRIAIADLVGNDDDVDGDLLTISSVGSAVGGTVATSGDDVVFVPAANFYGEASFEAVVTDGTDVALLPATVVVTVDPVNDAPDATADSRTTNEDTALVATAASLLANDTDVDGPSSTITGVSGAVNGTVALAGTTITFTPAANFAGAASFVYTVSDAALTDTAGVMVTVAAVNDPPIAVDDNAMTDEDAPLVIPAATLVANDIDIDDTSLTVAAVMNGMNGTVSIAGGNITFTPSTNFHGTATFTYTVDDGDVTDTGSVTVIVAAVIDCGDSEVEGLEECDDGNGSNTDGCTIECRNAVVCEATAFPGADRFAVDTRNGSCFAQFDDDMTTFATAQASCTDLGGYLATITDSTEDSLVTSVIGLSTPWIGAVDDANDTDSVFDWVTDEPFTFLSFASGQPDDDVGTGGNGECLHILDTTGDWNDTNCNFVGFVAGRTCEIEVEPCGDSVQQIAIGEQCDDGNRVDLDGCSSTCQVEVP